MGKLNFTGGLSLVGECSMLHLAYDVIESCGIAPVHHFTVDKVPT